MKKVLLCVIVFLAGVFGAAARDWNFSVGTDASTQFMWRGFTVGKTPTIVPTFTLNYNKDGFGFEAGYCSVTELQGDHYLEMDLWATARYKGFTFTALEQGLGNNLGIGGYNDNLELTLIYELPLEHFPASVSWNTFVAGDDFNLDGSRAFSSYAEIKLPCQFQNFSVCATAGAVPFKSEIIYKNNGGFKFINLNLRSSYTFTDGENFQLPIYAQYTYNPLLKNHTFLLGFSIMLLSL